MSTLLIFGLALRLCIILLGFAAMWSLWVAKRERGKLWTAKMKDIWLCHMVFVIAAVEGNIELFYREVMPTFAVLLLIFVLSWTIRGTFNGTTYFKTDAKP